MPNEKTIQVKKPEYRWTINPETHLLYLDAGAWQGNEKGVVKTNFVLISEYGAALCSYYPVPKSVPKNWVLGEWGFGQHSVEWASKPIVDFLEIMDPNGSPLDHIQYFFRSKDYTIPLWKTNSLLVVIGDLHLHLFRQKEKTSKKELVDNFVKVEGNTRKSLESDFSTFITKTVSFKDKYPKISVKIVQAGDILEIWEIEELVEDIIDKARGAHHFAEANKPSYSEDPEEAAARASASNPVAARLAKKYDEVLDGFVQRGILPRRYSRDISPKNLMHVMQTEIFPKIFNAVHYLNTWGIPIIVTIGNHDSALKKLIPKNNRHPLDRLDYKNEFNEGDDYLVHVEHGHRFDGFNKPDGGDWFGRWVTRRAVDFEKIGWGDFLKNLEEPLKEAWYKIQVVLYKIKFIDYLPLNERTKYLKASIDVASWFEKKAKPPKKVGIFIMAHTHAPYARKIPRNINYKT